MVAAPGGSGRRPRAHDEYFSFAGSSLDTDEENQGHYALVSRHPRDVLPPSAKLEGVRDLPEHPLSLITRIAFLSQVEILAGWREGSQACRGLC